MGGFKVWSDGWAEGFLGWDGWPEGWVDRRYCEINATKYKDRWAV